MAAQGPLGMRPAPGRFAVPLATFGTFCLLSAAGAILGPLAGDSHIGMAVIAFGLFVVAAVTSSRLGAPDDSVVNRTVADVLSAGAAFYLAGAAGNLVEAAGSGSTLGPVVAGLVALPYAAAVLLTRPGLWALLATAGSVVVASLGLVHLVHGAPGQADAAALAAVAVGFATAVARRWIGQQTAVVTISALGTLAAAAVLLGDSPGAADVTFAVLLLAVVTLVAAGSRAPSVVAALAVGAPVVVALALAHDGRGAWSVPLAMAWTGGGCALVAAYVSRYPEGERVGGVFSWCSLLVLVADLFLTASGRVHALVALVASAGLFGAAAWARRRPAGVIGALGILAALPRVVANAAAGRFLLLGLGAGLLYLASTSVRRSSGRTP